ncbi:defensin-like protein 199 [Arabidopsis lyrata subsp. lyrata]|uniref:defensin-like protein 199 n=1 Tax=Arabidopsis lyrata subsp. lyrata TaxID=81972 RepID=UPI000A29CCF2|nr:defensin-like protein 199 [Arabidopsis lyrata subsp. lyrata]|eukprot:XP_020866260.1 defensin-like protein 199 [Arabidopsis lyrata subsp. lyrata]
MVSSELHMICGADLNKTEGANQESSLLTKRKTDVREIKAIVQGTKMNKRNQSSKLEKFIKPILRKNIIKIAITMRTSVAFVFTIFFIISFVHSLTTTQGYGMLFDSVSCEGGFEYSPTPPDENVKCTAFCKTLPNKYEFGVCIQQGCCCHKNV